MSGIVHNGSLCFQLCLLLCIRMWINGGAVPDFLPEDNPAAFADSRQTRSVVQSIQALTDNITLSPTRSEGKRGSTV